MITQLFNKNLLTHISLFDNINFLFFRPFTPSPLPVNSMLQVPSEKIHPSIQFLSIPLTRSILVTRFSIHSTRNPALVIHVATASSPSPTAAAPFPQSCHCGPFFWKIPHGSYSRGKTMQKEIKKLVYLLIFYFCF